MARLEGWLVAARRYLHYLDQIVSFAILFVRAECAIILKRGFQPGNNPDIWLFAERGSDARDNAFHLFKYVRAHHPEIDARFVINATSPDFLKVADIGRTVEPNTVDHYLAFRYASRLISSHLYGAAPFGKAARIALPVLPQKKHAFLQHGVAANDLVIRSPHVDLLVLSSEAEIANFANSSRQAIRSARVLGLCRYDSLVDLSKGSEVRVVLIMPTFRKRLENLSRMPDHIERFRQDPYYQRWQSFLHSADLRRLARTHDFEVVFYLHHSAQKYSHNFSAPDDRIRVSDRYQDDVQALLRSSSLLVTDYSSVAFDFAYMGKPVVAYQFDRESFHAGHYPRGARSHSIAAVGQVLEYQDALLKEIEDIAVSGFETPDQYAQNSRLLFRFNDRSNTMRNFLAVRDM